MELDVLECGGKKYELDRSLRCFRGRVCGVLYLLLR